MAGKFEECAVRLLTEKPFVWYNGYKDVRFSFRQQATCRYLNGGHGRVDLAAHVYAPTKQSGGSFYNFEIKSCKADMDTNKGFNLFSMYNYLVYPRCQITSIPGAITFDMVAQKLVDIGCEHVGIIAVISDNEFVVERKARRYYGNGMPPVIKSHRHKYVTG